MWIRRHVTLVYPIYPPLFAFHAQHSPEASCLQTLLAWTRRWGEYCFVYFGKPFMNVRIHITTWKKNYTWVRKLIHSATCSPTLVHRRCSTWRPFMTFVIGGAQRGICPWQCIPLPFGNYYAHTIFLSSIFTLSFTETDSQPNVASNYVWTSVHISESMHLQTHVYYTLSLVLMCNTTSQNIRHFNILYWQWKLDDYF